MSEQALALDGTWVAALQHAARAKGWRHKLPRYMSVVEGARLRPERGRTAASVVVIAHRMLPGTAEMVAALADCKGSDTETIFVNNGMPGEPCEALAANVDSYIRMKHNTGAYLARNVGALLSRGDILLFLDDDAGLDEQVVASHRQIHDEYDVIAARGRVLPRTENPLNERARHYDLGARSFPVFADIEGNTSYRSETFFAADGWDDDIVFGGGGVELSRRLAQIEPDLRKQIYSPLPVIYHDYADSELALVKKVERQQASREYIRAKHPDIRQFVAGWEAYGATSPIPKVKTTS